MRFWLVFILQWVAGTIACDILKIILYPLIINTDNILGMLMIIDSVWLSFFILILLSLATHVTSYLAMMGGRLPTDDEMNLLQTSFERIQTKYPQISAQIFMMDACLLVMVPLGTQAIGCARLCIEGLDRVALEALFEEQFLLIQKGIASKMAYLDLLILPTVVLERAVSGLYSFVPRWLLPFKVVVGFLFVPIHLWYKFVFGLAQRQKLVWLKHVDNALPNEYKSKLGELFSIYANMDKTIRLGLQWYPSHQDRIKNLSSS